MKELGRRRISYQPGKIRLVDIRAQVPEMTDVDHGPGYVAMNPINLQGEGCKFYKIFLKRRNAKLGETDIIGQGGHNRARISWLLFWCDK
jgi:hypothetical protein